MKKVEFPPVTTNLYALKDNAEFLKYLSQLAFKYSVNYNVDKLASHLWKQGKVEALYNFTANTMKYIKDPVGVEKIMTPDLVAIKYFNNEPVYGDCDDKVLVLASLLLNRGYKVRIVGAHYLRGAGDKNQINHTYLEYYDNGRWIPLDPAYSRGFGQKAASVIPLKYFTPEISFVPVNDYINSGALKRISDYHTKIMKDIGYITPNDIPILSQYKEAVQNNEEIKQVIDDVIKYLKEHSYLDPDYANRLGAKNVHEILSIVSLYGRNKSIETYDKLLYSGEDGVGAVPIVVGAVVLFGIGVLIGVLTHASWQKCLTYGFLAVAIGGIVYLGWSALGGSASGVATVGTCINSLKAFPNTTQEEKRVAENIEAVKEVNGQVAFDTQTNKELTGNNNDKGASNSVMSFLKKLTGLLLGSPSNAVQDGTSEYSHILLKQEEGVFDKLKNLTPVLATGALVVSGLLLLKRKI